MRDLGNLDSWTRVELAQVVVQSLYNSPTAPAPENVNVRRLARRSKAHLVRLAELALAPRT